jgi:hypothetical protein
MGNSHPSIHPRPKMLLQEDNKKKSWSENIHITFHTKLYRDFCFKMAVTAQWECRFNGTHPDEQQRKHHVRVSGQSLG